MSQYILELFIKPKGKLNELYGILSRTLIQYHAKYINGNLNDEEIALIRLASTNLIAQAWICYKSYDKRKQFLNVSKEINFILSESKVEKKDFGKIIEAVKKIESLDSNIIITYEEYS